MIRCWAETRSPKVNVFKNVLTTSTLGHLILLGPIAEALTKAQSNFETQKARKLHKPVMHFPTGVLLMAEVEKVKERRLKDEQCLEDLKIAKT